MRKCVIQKAISMFLAVVLILGLLPLSAFAEGGGGSSTGEGSGEQAGGGTTAATVSPPPPKSPSV